MEKKEKKKRVEVEICMKNDNRNVRREKKKERDIVRVRKVDVKRVLSLKIVIRSEMNVRW